MHLTMHHEVEKSQECYNFQGIRDLLKKYKSHSAKQQHNNGHHHQQHRHRTHLSSLNNKVKPSDDSSIDTDEDFVKARDGKIQVADRPNGVKKIRKCSSDKLHYRSRKHGISDQDHHNNCFGTFILFSASKKKHNRPPKIASASDVVSDDNFQSAGREERKLPSRSKSLETRPSLGRSMTINNSRGEQLASRTPQNSRLPSLLRNVSSGSSKTSSFNGRNGSFVNRSTSIARSSSMTVDTPSTLKARSMSVSRSGPIIYSNSSGMLKPQAIERQLECTLEELCHGCVKHITVSRPVYTATGKVKQEDEVLTVNVKPGWRAGAKITFQGTADDVIKRAEHPADVIFIITEKYHPLFRRYDDDLELEIEIPLVDALAGCTLTIPLLGNDKMSLAVDDIIYPGCENIIVGQGMPNQTNPDHRGDLKVKFLVEFPQLLSDEKRSEMCRILCD